MRLIGWIFLLNTVFGYLPKSEEVKMHALFLMQKNDLEGAFDRYRDYCHATGHHDFEMLQQMGLLLLQKEIQTEDPQVYLMTLFGAGISGSSGALDILEKGLLQMDPQIQLLTLHFISQFTDDRAHDLFNQAMSSQFLSTRMEAAFHMAIRKHPLAAGQIEGLMYRLPPVFKPYFPSFFALIGTNEATNTLKRLIEDQDPQVRIESILNIARTGRDDFLPAIRRRLTHSHIGEVEAAIFAVGAMKDGASAPKLKKLATSPIDSLRLAAALALLQMGDRSFVPTIEEMARQNNLFAITALGFITESEGVLAELLTSSDFQVRINAALALLQRRDARCLPVVSEILIEDSRDFAFHPVGSVGRTMTAFKAVPSAELRSKDPTIDLSYSIAIREHFLKESVYLPEESFFILARKIFKNQQNDLVPTLISLLENLRTDQAVALLKEGTQKIQSPLIRDYCHLALYRMKQEGPHEEYINRWIAQQKESEMIRLRPLLPWKYRMEQSDYSLSAEEKSRLLIDSFLALANRRDEKSIDLLLDAIERGNPKNRPALMGLLMRATE